MQTVQLTFANKAKTLWGILRGHNLQAQKMFVDYHLIRRKYVLSRACEHLGKDKFEPAPLLNQRLLDVGCGNNRIAQELALRGAECTCIDPDADVLTRAEHDAQNYGAPIHFLQTTVETFVQDAPTFDIILCLDVLGHCKGSQHIISAMKKMLAPDGIILFSAVNNTFASFFCHKIIAEYVLRWVPWGTYGRCAFLAPKKLSKMLAKEGLEISQTAGVCFNPYTSDWYKTDNLSYRYMGTIRHLTPTATPISPAAQ